MGGFGSGEWRTGKATTEQSKRLDIRYMRKNGLLTLGRNGTLSWSVGGEHSGSIGYTVYNDRLVLNYSCTPYGQDESIPITQNIYLEKTSCHYGGERAWFMCPHCGSRREILYLHGRYFTCRGCADLAYSCQQEQPIERNYRQARKIRHKLKSDIDIDFNPDNLSDSVIFKPKGMHQKTFDRLRWKQAQHINSGMGHLSTILEKLIGRE